MSVEDINRVTLAGGLTRDPKFRRRCFLNENLLGSDSSHVSAGGFPISAGGAVDQTIGGGGGPGVLGRGIASWLDGMGRSPDPLAQRRSDGSLVRAELHLQPDGFLTWLKPHGTLAVRLG